ncbi:RNA polymerase sigma factor [Candidatus Soleaferrea massiliensis]|uniref:RNA polymerase sigma factor n=1 Tax=Candidatus Soleaferrea massiliensis TaxID=1470354 RepID=UPI00058E59A7|nr:RNA polymerase sigma factor [Candidatus Soleaferrea massiliensis]
MTDQLYEESKLIDQAIAGDKQSLEKLCAGVQDLVFSLSLRMLGSIHDAEDASQEIMIRILTNLSSFRRESAFSTWVYSVAVNHLRNYQKGMFAHFPRSLEFYGEDIRNPQTPDIPDPAQDVDTGLLAQELKLSCTNVMLQCLDTESRLIFILGTMFHLDSRIAGELLGLSPDAYRQRLSRIRRKMADFLQEYCELGGGVCRCANRVPHAVACHRIDPDNLEFSALQEWDRRIADSKESMERLDELSIAFAQMPVYRSPDKAKAFLREFLQANRCRILCDE